MGFSEKWPPPGGVKKVEILEAPVSDEQFREAIKNRAGLLMGISGLDRLDSVQKMNLDKNEKRIKEFIEQKKAAFFASLPEKVIGSNQREYTRTELEARAKEIFSGEEIQVETMTNGGELGLRKKVIEILALMKESGLDEYDLDKAEPLNWTPFEFKAKE